MGGTSAAAEIPNSRNKGDNKGATLKSEQARTLTLLSKSPGRMLVKSQACRKS